jgi:hypothetical protein
VGVPSPRELKEEEAMWVIVRRAYFHCLSAISAPPSALQDPPDAAGAFVATSDNTSNLDAIIERSEQPSHFLGSAE